MFRRKRALDKAIRRSFVVTKRDGSMFQGALIEHDDLQYVFAMVKVLDRDGAWVPAAEGRLYIDRVNVDYLQQVTLNAA